MELGGEARGGREEEVGGKYEVSRMASQSCSSLPAADKGAIFRNVSVCTDKGAIVRNVSVYH